jgi:hypothetical protein
MKTNLLAAAAFLTLGLALPACATDGGEDPAAPEDPAASDVTPATEVPDVALLQIQPEGAAPGANAAKAEAIVDRAVLAARAAAAMVVPDHCTLFCTSVYNGTNRSMWMNGNPGWYYIPSHQWSDDAAPALKDVDNIEVPGGCQITFRLHTYHQYETIRVHGWSPYVWLYGSC